MSIELAKTVGNRIITVEYPGPEALLLVKQQIVERILSVLAQVAEDRWTTSQGTGQPLKPVCKQSMSSPVRKPAQVNR